MEELQLVVLEVEELQLVVLEMGEMQVAVLALVMLAWMQHPSPPHQDLTVMWMQMRMISQPMACYQKL